MNGWIQKLATFEQRATSIDAASGTEVETWEPLVGLPGSPTVAEKFWVRVRDVRPARSEAMSNDLTVARNQVELRVRWRDDVTSALRITLHGDTDVVYQVIGGPAEVVGRKRELELLLERYSTT